MSYIGEIYPPAELANTNWSRVHLFYSLFTSIDHGLFGLQNLDEAVRPDLRSHLVGRVRVRLDELSAMYDTYTAREERRRSHQIISNSLKDLDEGQQIPVLGYIEATPSAGTYRWINIYL
jgi:hypothetical protein